MEEARRDRAGTGSGLGAALSLGHVPLLPAPRAPGQGRGGSCWALRPPGPAEMSSCRFPEEGSWGSPGSSDLQKGARAGRHARPAGVQHSSPARPPLLQGLQVPLWARCPHGFLEPWELGGEASAPSRWLPDARAEAEGTQAPNMVRRGPRGSTACTWEELRGVAGCRALWGPCARPALQLVRMEPCIAEGASCAWGRVFSRRASPSVCEEPTELSELAPALGSPPASTSGRAGAESRSESALRGWVAAAATPAWAGVERAPPLGFTFVSG